MKSPRRSPTTQTVVATAERYPSWLRRVGEELHLALRVQPRASRNAIAGALGAELRVQVTAPPVEAAANQALIHLLAAKLDCPRRLLRLVRGHSSRQKIVGVRELTPEEIVRHLTPGKCGVSA
jgi:hypothetical protein